MDYTVPSIPNAEIDAIMAMSWDEGLQEIDSFFTSPTEPSTVEGEPGVVEGVQEATRQGKEEEENEVLPEVLVANDVNHFQPTDDTNLEHHDSNTPSTTTTETQVPSDDEFATLTEDIDQVTADDVAPPDHRSQLHFILNDTSEPVIAGASTEPPKDVRSPEAPKQLPCRDPAGSSQQSPQHIPVEVLEQQVNYTEAHAETEPRAYDKSQQVPAAVPRTSFDADRGLTLLSPRHDQSLDLSPAFEPELAQQTQPQQPAANLVSLQQQQLTLPLLLPRPHLQALSPLPDVSVPQQSPDMPSSEGKSSLYEEMRDEEEEIRRSRLTRKIPAPVFQTQLNILQVAGSKEGEGPARPQDLLKFAEIAQQHAEAVRVKIRENVPRPTGQVEDEEANVDGHESEGIIDEPSKQMQATKGYENHAAASRKRSSTIEEISNVEGLLEREQMPQRRSTRQQALTQPYQDDSEDAADQVEDKSCSRDDEETESDEDELVENVKAPPPQTKAAAANGKKQTANVRELSESLPMPQRRSTRQQSPKQTYQDKSEDAAYRAEDKASSQESGETESARNESVEAVALPAKNETAAPKSMKQTAGSSKSTPTSKETKKVEKLPERPLVPQRRSTRQQALNQTYLEDSDEAADQSEDKVSSPVRVVPSKRKNRTTTSLVKTREDVPHVTGLAEDEATGATDNESVEVIEEPPKKKVAASKPSKQTAEFRKRPEVTNKTTRAKHLQGEKLVPQRRSTRQQQLKQTTQEDSDAGVEHSEHETSEAAPLVPSKRKSSTLAPPTNSKKRKTRPQLPTAVDAGLDQANQEDATTDSVSRNQRPYKSTLSKELKSIDYGILGAPLSPGPRKTRAQKEQEIKKEEEEAKKLPNAGRAAKARHRGK